MTRLALLGDEPAVHRPFPRWPQSTEMELHLLRETLESGNWWRMTGTHKYSS